MADTAFGLTVPNFLLFQITTLYLILFVRRLMSLLFALAFSSHPIAVQFASSFSDWNDLDS